MAYQAAQSPREQQCHLQKPGSALGRHAGVDTTPGPSGYILTPIKRRTVFICLRILPL
jgi:hypothetical protein